MSASALTELLASFVPRLIQKKIIENPVPIDAPYAQDFPAVVLFADLSGFTNLTERLAERGPQGVETLARILNDYFGQLIDIIYTHDGDVAKIAGDALIAVWSIAPAYETRQSISTETQRQWTLRAAECALNIRAQLKDYRAAGATLSLKLALATGRVWQSHIGGVYDRWDFALVGDPLIEVSIANNHARAGDIILTPSAWRLVGEMCNATPFKIKLPTNKETAARLQSLPNSSQVPARGERLQIPDQAQSALLPYIPGAISHRISAGQSDWLSELRKVTIIFINLPDMGRKTSLQTAHEIMRSIQTCVYRYEGSINKISQDDKGIVVDAAFGLPPLMHMDDPGRGIRAAMLIRSKLRAVGLRGAIGVTTGRVFCGLVGTDQRRVYTMFGDSVNLTARLMSLAALRPEVIEGNEIAILCDRPTYEAAKEEVEFEALSPQRVKGRRRPVDVFRPLRENVGVVRRPTELIGRRKEKAVLVNGIQELQRGAPFRAIVLHGEAGMGKSRLMEELLQQAKAYGLHAFFGETDPIERNSPYFAWRAIFNRLFEIEELVNKPQLSPEDRANVQAAVLRKIGEANPEFVRHAPLLSVILPFSIPENEFTAAMTGEVRGGNIRDLLVRLLHNEASRSPILIAMEDLHWFDSASWTLLGDVYQRVRPLLLVVDTRPLSLPAPQPFKDLAERADTEFIRLDMLSLDDVESLVCQRLGVETLPAQVGKLIRDKSEGHPFFAEELAYALRDSGVILIDGQQCRLAPGMESVDSISLTLPDTLQATITSRIDSLNPSQQLTLKVASVIGRVFAYRMLEAIHPIETDKAALPGYLETLTRLRLTRIESDAPDLAYIFKHAVTRDVAYNLMVFSQRRQLHQAIAEWIEQSYSQDLEPFYTVLAYHWRQAAEMPGDSRHDLVVNKTLHYLEKAGDQSLRNFANAEALQFFSHAIQFAEPGRVSKLRLGGWYRKLATAYLGLGKIVEAKEYIVKALATLEHPLPASNLSLIGGVLNQVTRQAAHRLQWDRFRRRKLDPAEEELRMEIVHLCDALGIVQFLNGDPNPLPMLYAVLTGLNTAETMKETPELWSAYASISAVTGFIPLHSQSRYYKERWKALGQTMDHPDAYVRGVIALCTVASGNGEWQEVKELVEKAFAICNELGDHRQAGDAIAYLGVNTLLEGGPKLWQSYHERIWEVAMRRGNPIHIAFAYQAESTALVWMGDYDGCIAGARTCIALSEKSWVGEIPEYIVRSAMWLALWRNGERSGVWDSVKHALDKFSRAAVVDFSAYLIHSHLAEVVFLGLEEGKKNGLWPAPIDEVEQYMQLAIKNLKKFCGVFAIGRPALDRYRGQLAWYQDRHEKAYRLWQSASRRAHALPFTYEAGRAELLLAQNLPVDNPERTNHAQKACEVFASSGYENWAAISSSYIRFS